MWVERTLRQGMSESARLMAKTISNSGTKIEIA